MDILNLIIFNLIIIWTWWPTGLSAWQTVSSLRWWGNSAIIVPLTTFSHPDEQQTCFQFAAFFSDWLKGDCLALLAGYWWPLHLHLSASGHCHSFLALLVALWIDVPKNVAGRRGLLFGIGSVWIRRLVGLYQHAHLWQPAAPLAGVWRQDLFFCYHSFLPSRVAWPKAIADEWLQPEPSFPLAACGLSDLLGHNRMDTQLAAERLSWLTVGYSQINSPLRALLPCKVFMASLSPSHSAARCLWAFSSASRKKNIGPSGARQFCWHCSGKRCCSQRPPMDTTWRKTCPRCAGSGQYPATA